MIHLLSVQGCFENVTGHNWAEYFACNQCTHAFHSHRHVYIDVQCAEGSSVAFTECQAEGCDPESCGERTVFTPTNNCIERGDSSGEWRTVRWSPHPPEIPEGEPGAWFSVDETSPAKPPKNPSALAAESDEIKEIDLPYWLHNDQCHDDPQMSAHNWKVGCNPEIGDTGSFIDRQCSYDRRYWFDVRCDDAACSAGCHLKKIYDTNICCKLVMLSRFVCCASR